MNLRYRCRRVFIELSNLTHLPPALAKVKHILQQASCTHGSFITLRNSRHLGEDSVELLVVAPRRLVQRRACSLKKHSKCFKSLGMNWSLDKITRNRQRDFSHEHASANEFAHQLYIPQHFGFIFNLLFIEFAAKCWRFQVLFEGNLALVQQDAFEVAVCLQRHVLLRQPIMKLHAQIDVHVDEVVLNCSLLKDHLHQNRNAVVWSLGLGYQRQHVGR
mmetsp:Transcript_52843/g.141145  ORF Transcript_52843/g.141145 Transcript_52843/m.141145 type:complete len:218 (-) Transcript_52843:935-1588(-)